LYINIHIQKGESFGHGGVLRGINNAQGRNGTGTFLGS